MQRLLLVALLLGPPASAGEREPVVAGVLGVVPGFGAGYYYAGHSGKALTFTVVDTALMAGTAAFFVAGVDGVFDHLFTARGPDHADTLLALSAVCAWARIGSGIYQGIDGALTVAADQRAARAANPPRMPRFACQFGLTDFAPRGPVSPPVVLNVNAARLGATLSFNGRF